MTTASREDMAWAGGLFEGEGCFSVRAMHNGSLYPSPGAEVCMTDEDVIRRFAAIIGIGSVVGPYQPRNPKWKASWRWRCHGFPSTQAVVAMLWPWLGQRRQARAAEILVAGRGVGYSESARHGHQTRRLYAR